MKKNGFTLVELLVSVGLLAVLAVIIILNVNSNLKDQKAKEYEEFVNKVKAAANIYMASNPEAEIYAKDEENGYNIISISRLADTGLLSLDTLIDPETNLPLSDDNLPEAKKYIKLYDDEKMANNDKSNATLIEYPALGDLSTLLRTIRYEMNNFGTCQNTTVPVGELATLCTPSDNDAKFLGWYIDNKLTITAPLTEGKYRPMEDVTLYAKWKKTKVTSVNSFTITSNNTSYNDQNVTVALKIKDVYGGNVSLCISNQNNISSCTNWEKINLKKNEEKDYSKNINLADFNSGNTTGSGNNITLYAFIKNSASEEDSSIYASKSVSYKIYKYCDSMTTYSTGEWGSCSKSCGGGTKKRTLKRRDAYFSSVNCSDKTESTSCNTMDCCSKVNETEGSWSSCSASCGGGTQIKTITLTSAYDGSSCGTREEKQDCNTMDCCSNITMTYGEWGTCSASCGGGTQTRTGTKTSNYDGSSCGTETEEQACNTSSCCTYSYCEVAGQYNGQTTYYACGNCGCDSSPNYASDLLLYKGLDCTGSGSSSSNPNCYNGGSLIYSSGFNCYPVCYQQMNLVWYGPMADGTYDWGCYSGWIDYSTYCYQYYCPSY